MTRIRANVDNFGRAETHRMMADLQRDAGGVNSFAHNRELASVEQQTVSRMNRDTLYSFAVVDVSAGASLRFATYPSSPARDSWTVSRTSVEIVESGSSLEEVPDPQ